VVFTSAVNIVEIWDKDLYEQSKWREDIDFAELAEDVMGNINDDDNGIS
jgi:MraZ protein